MSHNEFDWVPADGLWLSREEVIRVFVNLRALISGTETLEPNRAFAVDIATVLAAAMEEDAD